MGSVTGLSELTGSFSLCLGLSKNFEVSREFQEQSFVVADVKSEFERIVVFECWYLAAIGLVSAIVG